MKSKFPAVLLAAFLSLGLASVAWTRRPGKEAGITGLHWSKDAKSWNGFQNAILPSETVYLGGSFVNKSSIALSLILTLSMTDSQGVESTYDFSRTVEPNEEVMLYDSATLTPGESYTANAILHEEGTMQELDRVNIAFNVVAVAPGEIAITDLTINPQQSSVGDQVTITWKATNVGALGVSYDAIITGDITANKGTVSLAPGGSKVFIHTVIVSAARTYTVSIEDVTGTFTVTSPTVKPKGKIIGIRFNDNTGWKNLSGQPVPVNQALSIGVSWENYFLESYDIKGSVELVLKSPDGTKETLQAKSGQDSILPPRSSVSVVYDNIYLDPKGAWGLSAVLAGEIV